MSAQSEPSSADPPVPPQGPPSYVLAVNPEGIVAIPNAVRAATGIVGLCGRGLTIEQVDHALHRTAYARGQFEALQSGQIDLNRYAHDLAEALRFQTGISHINAEELAEAIKQTHAAIFDMDPWPAKELERMRSETGGRLTIAPWTSTSQERAVWLERITNPLFAGAVPWTSQDARIPATDPRFFQRSLQRVGAALNRAEEDLAERGITFISAREEEVRAARACKIPAFPFKPYEAGGTGFTELEKHLRTVFNLKP